MLDNVFVIYKYSYIPRYLKTIFIYFLIVMMNMILKRNYTDDFRDMIKHSEKALKEVWDNKDDDIWDKY